jgi:hypothetical protein
MFAAGYCPGLWEPSARTATIVRAGGQLLMPRSVTGILIVVILVLLIIFLINRV